MGFFVCFGFFVVVVLVWGVWVVFFVCFGWFWVFILFCFLPNHKFMTICLAQQQTRISDRSHEPCAASQNTRVFIAKIVIQISLWLGHIS